MRGSYLFIIRKAIFFDKLDPLWSSQNAARPNLWHAAHPQTFHPESIHPLLFVRRNTMKHNLLARLFVITDYTVGVDAATSVASKRIETACARRRCAD